MTGRIIAKLQKLPPMTLSVLVTLAIIYLTLVPRPLPDVKIELFAGADKVVHFIMFGGQAGAIALDVTRRRGVKRLTVVVGVLIVLGVIAFGGLIEYLQPRVTDGMRSGDMFDWCADALGALAGVPAAYLLSKALFVGKSRCKLERK